MSEPLYRIWDIALMQYSRAEGGYFVNLNGYVHDNLTDDNANRQDMFIIQRCTGEQDVNGKYIYEGDIIQYGSMLCGYDKAVIEFDKGQFKLNSIKKSQLENISTYITVIGNSLENPELLLERLYK